MNMHPRPGRNDADLEGGDSQQEQTGSGQQDDAHRSLDPVAVTSVQVRLSAYFSKAIAWINWLLPATFVGKMFYLYHMHSMVWYNALFFGILSLGSLIPASCYFGLFSSGRGKHHVERLCEFAYASTMLRMGAAFTLLLFYGVVYYILIAPLVLFLALLLLIRRRTFTFQLGETSTTELLPPHIAGAEGYWGPHGTQLEYLFDLSREAVSMGFSGLCGAVLGYVKNSLDLKRGHKTPECFLFYGTAIGLLVELLATVPPSVYYSDTRQRVVNVYLRFLAYTAVLFLIMGCLAAAEAMLHELIFFAFFANVVVVARCFWKNHTDNGTHLKWKENRSDEDHKAEIKDTLHLVAIHAAMFPVLMASYSTYVGSDSSLTLSWQFKVFVLSMLSSIVTYFTRIAVVLETRYLDSTAFPKQAWERATYLLRAFPMETCQQAIRVHLIFLLMWRREVEERDKSWLLTKS